MNKKKTKEAIDHENDPIEKFLRYTPSARIKKLKQSFYHSTAPPRSSAKDHQYTPDDDAFHKENIPVLLHWIPLSRHDDVINVGKCPGCHNQPSCAIFKYEKLEKLSIQIFCTECVRAPDPYSTTVVYQYATIEFTRWMPVELSCPNVPQFHKDHIEKNEIQKIQSCVSRLIEQWNRKISWPKQKSAFKRIRTQTATPNDAKYKFYISYNTNNVKYSGTNHANGD